MLLMPFLAPRLLGAVPGVVSGSALVVDYVLTVVAGCDGIFSL
jgi:hypothetical protein